MEDSKEDQSIDFFNASHASDDSGWNNVDIDFGQPEPHELVKPPPAISPVGKASMAEQASTVAKNIRSTNEARVANHASTDAKGSMSGVRQPSLGLPPTLSALSNESKSGIGTSPRVAQLSQPSQPSQPSVKDQQSKISVPALFPLASNVPVLKKEANGALATPSTSIMKATQPNTADPLELVSSSGRDGNGLAGLGIASSLAAARTQTQPGTISQQQASTQAGSAVKPQATSGIVQMAQASLSMTKKLQLPPNTATQQTGTAPQPQVAVSTSATKSQPQRAVARLPQAPAQTADGAGIIGRTQTVPGLTTAKSVVAVDGKTQIHQSGTSTQQQLFPQATATKAPAQDGPIPQLQATTQDKISGKDAESATPVIGLDASSMGPSQRQTSTVPSTNNISQVTAVDQPQAKSMQATLPTSSLTRQRSAPANKQTDVIANEFGDEEVSEEDRGGEAKADLALGTSAARRAQSLDQDGAESLDNDDTEFRSGSGSINFGDSGELNFGDDASLGLLSPTSAFLAGMSTADGNAIVGLSLQESAFGEETETFMEEPLIPDSSFPSFPTSSNVSKTMPSSNMYGQQPQEPSLAPQEGVLLTNPTSLQPHLPVQPNLFPDAQTMQAASASTVAQSRYLTGSPQSIGYQQAPTHVYLASSVQTTTQSSLVSSSTSGFGAHQQQSNPTVGQGPTRALSPTYMRPRAESLLVRPGSTFVNIDAGGFIDTSASAMPASRHDASVNFASRPSMSQHLPQVFQMDLSSAEPQSSEFLGHQRSMSSTALSRLPEPDSRTQLPSYKSYTNLATTIGTLPQHALGNVPQLNTPYTPTSQLNPQIHPHDHSGASRTHCAQPGNPQHSAYSEYQNPGIVNPPATPIYSGYSAIPAIGGAGGVGGYYSDPKSSQRLHVAPTPITAATVNLLPQAPHPVLAFGFGGRVVVYNPVTKAAGHPGGYGNASSSSLSTSLRVSNLTSCSIASDDDDLEIAKHFPLMEGFRSSNAWDAWIEFCNHMTMWGTPGSMFIDSKRALWRVLCVFAECAKEKQEDHDIRNRKFALALSQATTLKPLYSFATGGSAPTAAAASSKRPNPLRESAAGISTTVSTGVLSPSATLAATAGKGNPVGAITSTSTLATNSNLLQTNLEIRAQVAKDVEAFIAAGETEKAMDRAVSSNCWDIALAVSAALGGSSFQWVMREYSRVMLNPSSTLHTVCTSMLRGSHRTAENSASLTEFDLENWKWEAASLCVLDSFSPARRNSLQELGDLLASKRRDFFASHICYVLGECEIRTDPSAHIALLSSDHYSYYGRRVSLGCTASVVATLLHSACLTKSRDSIDAGLHIPMGLVPFCLPLAWELCCLGRSRQALGLVELMTKAVRASYTQQAQKSSQVFTPPFLACLQDLELRLRSVLGVKTEDSNVGKTSLLSLAKQPSALVGKVTKLFGASSGSTGNAASLSSVPGTSGMTPGYAGSGMDLRDPGRVPLGPKPARRGWDSIVASAVGVLTMAEGEEDVSPKGTTEQTMAGSDPSAFHYAAPIQPPFQQQQQQQQQNHHHHNHQHQSATYNQPPRDVGQGYAGQRVDTDAVDRFSSFQSLSGVIGDGNKEAQPAIAPIMEKKEAVSKQSKTDGTNASGSSTWGNFLAASVGDKIRSMVGPKKAHLGQENKFYFNEKLNRWVIEGEEDLVADEPSLAPPPTDDLLGPSHAPQSKPSQDDLGKSLNGLSDRPTTVVRSFEPSSSPSTNPVPLASSPTGASGVPPSSGNRFTARPRTGARSRYVDTFGNQDQSAAAAVAAPVARPVALNPGMPLPSIFMPVAPPTMPTASDDLDAGDPTLPSDPAAQGWNPSDA